MKLFGKKDDAPTDAPELDSPAEGDADTGLGDPATDDASGEPAADASGDISAEGGELTAPARPAADGGNKKKLLIGLGALVLLGGLGGGGYFYFMSGSDVPMPAHPVPPMNVAAIPPAAQPAPPAATPAGTPATPPGAPAATAAATPPMPAIPPGATPAAAAPPNPAVAAATPATPPGLGQPPGDEANAIAPTPSGTPPGAAPVAPVAPAATPSGTAPGATAAATPKTPSALSPTPGIEAPGEEPPADLPMPVGVATPAGAAAAATASPVAPTASTPAGTATAATASQKPDAKGKTPAASANAKGAEPSDAEKAIVQNAAVLDQLSTNAPSGATNRPFDPSQAPPDQTNSLRTVDQLLQQPAIIRPLPPAWLTVKKERESDDVGTRLVVAREALAQNNNTAALQMFTELREKYPKDKRILMGRAVALQKLGQEDAALSAYEAVLNGDPKNLEALTNMLGLLKKKDPKLALEKLEQLRETYPYNADITAQLGIACGAAGRYDEALKYLDMAEALHPGSTDVLYNKAVLYDKMGQNQKAGELYREVIRMSADGSLDQNLPIDAIKRRLAVLR